MASVAPTSTYLTDTDIDADTAKKYKDNVDEFLEKGLVDTSVKALRYATTNFYGLEIQEGSLLVELRNMLNELIDSKTKGASKGGGGSMLKGGGQRGGTSLAEMLDMFKRVVTGGPAPETYFNKLIWFFHRAGAPFKVVYDLVHNKLAPLPPPTQPMYQQFYDRIPEMKHLAATATARAWDATPAGRVWVRDLAAAGPAATAAIWRMPLGVRLPQPYPDRLAMILTMVNNIKPENWVVILSAGYTAVSFLIEMNKKLQEKLVKNRETNAEAAATMDAQDKVDTEAQTDVFRRMSDEFFTDYFNDHSKPGFVAVTDVAKQDAEEIITAAVERVTTLLANDDADLKTPMEDRYEAIDIARGKRPRFDPSGAGPQPGAAELGSQTGAAELGSQTGSFGGNRTMNRRKKSRRSKTIRKKRRLGNPIKKRKQFTKKRKARNKGKRKTRR